MLQGTTWFEIALVFGGGALVFITTAIATLLLQRLALRFGLVDKPDHRKIHKSPIPRIGGIAILAGFFTGVLYYAVISRTYPSVGEIVPMPNRFFLTGAIVIAVTGLVDDLRGLNFRQKLVLQSMVATFLILADYRINLATGGMGVFSKYWIGFSIPVTFLWIIGVINAINLIDGLDGLAGGVALISLTVITFCTVLVGHTFEVVLVFSMCGALIGFLYFNSHPARIFMGDTGSLFLGYVLAAYSLGATEGNRNHFLFLVPVLALGFPVFDTLLSMARRYLQGRPMFYPDKDHIHHRVRSLFKLNHRQSVLLLYAIHTVFGLFAFLIAKSGNAGAIFWIVMTGLYVLVLLWYLKYINRRKLKQLFKKNKGGTNTPFARLARYR